MKIHECVSWLYGMFRCLACGEIGTLAFAIQHIIENQFTVTEEEDNG